MQKKNLPEAYNRFCDYNRWTDLPARSPLVNPFLYLDTSNYSPHSDLTLMAGVSEDQLLLFWDQIFGR